VAIIAVIIAYFRGFFANKEYYFARTTTIFKITRYIPGVIISITILRMWLFIDQMAALRLERLCAENWPKSPRFFGFGTEYPSSILFESFVLN
jgi:hypothetical protein